MWRPILCFVLLVLPAFYLHAQSIEKTPPRISPLFNYLTSNSYLHRSPVFRDMQDNINTKMKDVKPGLRVDYFFDKMSAVHKALGQRLQAEFNSTDSFIRIYLVDEARKDSNRAVLDSLKLSDVHLSVFYNQVITKWRKKLQHELTKAFNAIEDPATRKVIAEQVRNILRTVITEPATGNLQEPSSDSSTDLSTLIVDTYFQATTEFFKKDIEERLGSSIWSASVSKDVATPTIALLNEFFDQVHATVARVLEKTEHVITTGVQEISTWLISGNTGIAVERGAGDFSGGVHLSLNIGKGVQIGTYLNSNFTADTSQPGRWLVGLQARFLVDKTQFDFLFSGLVGNHDRFRDWEILEAGGSVQSNLCNFILGGSLFLRSAAHHGGNASLLTTSWGIFYKPLSPRAPTFLIGGVHSTPYNSPFFKIIYPITGQQ